LAAGKETGFILSGIDEASSDNGLIDLLQLAALFDPGKPAMDDLYNRFNTIPKFKAIFEGSFLRPASYVKPLLLPTPEQLKDGFTVECFINTQKKQNVNHIICNGGSWEESGFSLLTVGGNLRGELQNIETQEKTMMDVSYPYDNEWHHVAMIYDAKKREAMIYFDGVPATLPTSYKSPLTFNPKYLRIGDNEMRRMGYTGGISDVKIWNKVLTEQTIQKHASGQINSDLGEPLLDLPMRFSSVQDAKELKNKSGFIAKNIIWKQSNVEHPAAKGENWVYAQFRNQGFGNGVAFANAGILEYRRGNYEGALELLFRAFNNGRFLPEVKIRTGWGDQVAKIFLAMSFHKNGRKVDYERFRIAINADLSKFEMRTWELPGEKGVLDRIKLKTLQREMNALANE
jgi:hypothetical protein